MMSLAVIPIKNLKDSKSRLAGFIDGEARADLTVAMLTDELKTLERTSIDRIAIVSSDRRIENLAYEYGLDFIYDNGLPLNESLSIASSWASGKGVEAMIILPVDIPLIEPEDVEGVFEVMDIESPKGVAVIAPCRRFDGTNLLALKPFKGFGFKFGKDSYRRHLQEAVSIGLEVYVYLSETVSLDIDMVDDLIQLYGKVSRNSCTFRFLEKLLKGSTSQI
jgi:2-phospho-L-lactate guanylyltransferase